MTTDNLPKTLRRLAWLIERGEVRQRYVECLTRAANVTVRGMTRDRALVGLAGFFGGESLWATAGEITATLERFEGTAWPRIRAGYREPHGELETLCTRLLEGHSAPCQRSIWNLLRESRKLKLNSTIQSQPDTLAVT